tara:strand:- start:766 stop:1290 length:525 start_codon:yes stop_codon:yes gene_type:complete
MHEKHTQTKVNPGIIACFMIYPSSVVLFILFRTEKEMKIISKNRLAKQNMFPQMPEEMERMIWRSFWSMYVLQDVKRQEPIWVKPSGMLFVNTSDTGAIQLGHTDLERRYVYLDASPHCHEMSWILGLPYGAKCEDCYYERWGKCELEEEDNEFGKKVTYWWDLEFYDEFPERM